VRLNLDRGEGFEGILGLIMDVVLVVLWEEGGHDVDANEFSGRRDLLLEVS
jgi:hypothetical protein